VSATIRLRRDRALGARARPRIRRGRASRCRGGSAVGGTRGPPHD